MENPSLLFNQKNQQKISKINTKSKQEVRLNEMTESDLLLLAESLTNNRSVEYLKLNMKIPEGKPYPEVALKAVFDAIQNNHDLPLKTIVFAFSDNFGDNGAKLLADFIRKNNKIKSVDLTRTDISDEGAIAIANALKENQALIAIHLQQNQLTDKSLKAIAEMCGVNKKLEFCNLNVSRKITSAGVNELIQAMEKRDKKIDFHIEEGTEIPKDVLAKLAAACENKGPRP